MFRLSKWYMDLVTDDGTALIAYSLSIEWATIRVRAASVLVAEPNAKPRESTSWSRVAPPTLRDGVLRFAHDGLGVEGEWHRTSPPFESTLIEDETGRVAWECHVPRARAAVSLRGRTFVGSGYAECLTMTRLPWTLPLRHLRWGRFTGQGHSAVWIAWRGGSQHDWVWLDGAPQLAATADDFGVTVLDARRELRLSPVRDICDRRALRALFAHAPLLADAVAGPLRNLRDTKRLARGALLCDGATQDEGWTIHEVVAW